MAKLKKGDILSCGECGLKVLVLSACEEEACDLNCCGEAMESSGKAGKDDWKKFVKETGPDDWKKFAE